MRLLSEFGRRALGRGPERGVVAQKYRENQVQAGTRGERFCRPFLGSGNEELMLSFSMTRQLISALIVVFVSVMGACVPVQGLRNRLRTGPRVFSLWRNSRDGLDRQD